MGVYLAIPPLPLPMADAEDVPVSTDDRLPAELGYKAEFKRELNVWTTTAFCFSVMAAVACTSA